MPAARIEFNDGSDSLFESVDEILSNVDGEGNVASTIITFRPTPAGQQSPMELDKVVVRVTMPVVESPK